MLTLDIKTNIKETDIHTVNKMILNTEPFVLIDVREESEWINGYIPGAIHVSKGVIERDIEQHVPDVHTKIVLYCGGGSRATLAADNLQKMGYKNVFYMQGGFRGWQNAGLAVAKN